MAAGALLLALSGQAYAQGRPAARSPEGLCRQFLGRTFEGATVTKAVLMSAKGLELEHCLIHGEMSRDLEFGVRMPTQWNHRTLSWAAAYWLEKGVQPSTSTIIATQSATPAGAQPISRPLCKFPTYPKYTGGNPNLAGSFVCAVS